MTIEAECVPVISALKRLRQEDHLKSKASLKYIVIPYLKKRKKFSKILITNYIIFLNQFGS